MAIPKWPSCFGIAIFYLAMGKHKNFTRMGNGKFFTILGWVATGTAMAMYVSYIPQIGNNLNGIKGDWLQPLVAAINCTLWVTYGILKKPKRDWPIAIANFPGIVFGLFTFLTAI